MEQRFPKKSESMVVHRPQPIKGKDEDDIEASAYNRLKELEALSRRSEERYAALAQAIAQITWTVAPDGKVVEDNPFWRAYTGQSEAPIKGWGWLEAVHPDDRARVVEVGRQAIMSGTMYETEYRIRRADGVYRYFLVRGVPIFEEDGTLREWVGICTDITERQLLGEHLMARAGQLEAIFETIADGLVVYDQKGNVVQTNIAARQLLNPNLNGYESDVYERLKTYAMRDEHGKKITYDQMPLVRILHGEELTGNNAVDIQLSMLDGRKIQVNASGAPMRDNEGCIVGAVCVFRDVTERRHLEVEHLRLLAALQETNTHLEQVNKVQSDFISIVSHEFRTTLTGIQGFSELLRDGDFDATDVKDYATDINIDAQRLSRMITELLDLERMKSGKMVFHMGRLNLNTLLIEVIERTRINTLHHSIHYNLEEPLPEVIGDSDKLTQVVTNLLSNAIKYSPDGGDILITSRREGDFVRVSVQDSGMGIPAQALEKIFTAYNRVDSEKTRYIQGTGLGLPIVQQIIKGHGGMVGVKSTSGQGSTFYFTLPL